MKTRLRGRITHMWRYRAGIARKAAAAEALLLCILAHMRAATLYCKLLPVIRLYRAGM